MGKLIIVRHGETDYNVEGRYTGRINVELNQKGIEQAEVVAKRLKDISINIIISSTLKRARETSNIINKELQLSVIEMEELVEKSVGVYEGLKKEEAKNKYPQMWSNNAPEGAETLIDVEKRVHKALKRICDEYAKDKNVLIVTHGYITKVINKYFNNSSEEEFAKYVLGNCELEEYSI